MNVSDYIRNKSSTSTKDKVAVIGDSTSSFFRLTAEEKNIVWSVVAKKKESNCSESAPNNTKINAASLPPYKRITKPAKNHFPGKLHDLIDFAEKEGLDHVISWTHDNTAICVQNTYLLMGILPRFFSQTKYRSFERQLNMWSFERTLDRLTNTITYAHPYFVKGQKLLCRFLTRENFRTAAAKAKNEETNGRLSPTSLKLPLSQEKDNGTSNGSSMTLQNIFTENILLSRKNQQQEQQNDVSNADAVFFTKHTDDSQISETFFLRQMQQGQQATETLVERIHQKIANQEQDNVSDIIDPKLLDELLLCESTLDSQGDLAMFEGRQFFLVDGGDQ